MTAHPIDTEALRARLAPLAWHSTPPITTDHVRYILDALDAAEYRATRAEAQSEARRIDNEYWKDLARRRTAQIKAAQDVLDRHAHYGLVEADDIRRALDGER